jgi:serine/threonine protein kinase
MPKADDHRWQHIDLPELHPRNADPMPVVPKLLGRFTIHEEIGSGGMARVHRATERLPNGHTREVAIKRPQEEGMDQELWIECLAHEASIMKTLDHPNVVKSYESGPCGDSFYISMEYIAGHSLNEVLRVAAGSIPPQIIVRLLRDLCGALDHIHNATDREGQSLGLIHRDISPANLIVDGEGKLRVLDFGIAKASLTSEHTGDLVKGKLGYLAPEAITRSEALDARSDLFSLGIVAHELLAGRPLFTTKSARGTVARALTAMVRPPSEYNPSCPSLLDGLVLKALTRTRTERAQTAAELLLVLEAIAEKLPCTHEQVAEWFQKVFADSPSRSARQANFKRRIATATDYLPEDQPRISRCRALTLPLRPAARGTKAPRPSSKLVTFRRPATPC